MPHPMRVGDLTVATYPYSGTGPVYMGCWFVYSHGKPISRLTDSCYAGFLATPSATVFACNMSVAIHVGLCTAGYTLTCDFETYIT